MKNQTVRVARSQGDFFQLIRLREEVFVVEQEVPIEIELDQDDDRAIHFIARAGQDVVGTARLVVEERVGKIGRMAVRKRWRGRGIGRKLVDLIKKVSNEMDLSELILHAQEQAIPFYERLGFSVEGKRFKEAGIWHRKMVSKHKIYNKPTSLIPTKISRTPKDRLK
jgi:predicted GNAT family N-acyltransferase